MKRLLAVLLLLGLSLPALSATPYRPGQEEALRGLLVDLSVVDRAAAYPLPIYRAQGLRFIEGTPGQAYSVRMTNRTGERLLVVLAVDGINAISGRTAAYNQTGYVLAPYASVEITGWRQSLQRVAQFVFTRPSDSYAARTDRPWQVGVIGAAVFREDRPEPVYYPSAPSIGQDHSAAEGAPAPAASKSAQSDTSRSVGTGYGQSEWSQATAASFVRRSSSPDEVLRLDYDDRAGLYRRGVRFFDDRPYDRPYPREPDAFPEGFAPPPRW